MSIGLVTFLVAISIPFDIIGAVPFLGLLTAFVFMLVVKSQLHMAGYERGVMRSVLVFVINMTLEALSFGPYIAHTVYSFSSFAFNRWDVYWEEKAEQQKA